jgi:hypothetical protein
MAPYSVFIIYILLAQRDANTAYILILNLLNIEGRLGVM